MITLFLLVHHSQTATHAVTYRVINRICPCVHSKISHKRKLCYRNNFWNLQKKTYKTGYAKVFQFYFPESFLINSLWCVTEEANVTLYWRISCYWNCFCFFICTLETAWSDHKFRSDLSSPVCRNETSWESPNWSSYTQYVLKYYENSRATSVIT
jgi:hypothetical protein